MTKTIFWDVDTQYDFMMEDGKLYVPGAEEIIPNLEKLTRYAREHGIPIFGSVDEHTENDQEISSNPDFQETFPQHCMKDAQGQEKIDATKPENPLWIESRQYEQEELTQLVKEHDGEIIFKKQKFDVFSNPNVDAVLDIVKPALFPSLNCEGNETPQIVVYGVALDVCDAYAIEGLLERKKYKIVLVEDATKAIIPERGQKLIEKWKQKGVQILTTEDVLSTGQPVQHVDEEKSNEVRKLAFQYIGRGHKTYTPTQLVIKKAEGVYLWNAEGRKLIDFASGVLVANLGHNHPYFEEGFRKYTHGLPRNAYNTLTEVEVLAAKRLIEKLDCPRLQKILWADSGSAGIIKAMWAVQHLQPDRHIILATKYGFHGKKGLAGDVTGEESENPNVRFISFPACDYCNLVPESKKGDEKVCKPIYEKELAELQQKYPNQIALLITEPYLGAKGSFHPPKWYLQLLNNWCDENGITFVLDEVQACFGRTGEMFAFQKYGIEPDIIVLAKGLGNGEPVCAVVGREELIDALDYGVASDTFSGNPRACAAILAVLDTSEKFPIVENCKKIGSIVEAGLNKLKEDFEFVTYIRGEGLVFGLEVQGYKSKTASEIANECVLQCYREGLHLMGPLADKVLRISPPLIITEEQAKAGLQLMYNAFEKIREIL